MMRCLSRNRPETGQTFDSLGGCLHFVTVVAAGNLGIQFHPHAVLDEVIRKIHTLHDFDPSTGDGFVFLVAHGAQEIDPPNAHPIQGIGHHGLKARVADSSNGFGVVEVHVWAITTVLVHTCVVNPELDHFSQTSSLLAEVDHNAHTTSLRALHSFLDGKQQIGTAAANVAAEDVRTDALVVDAHRHLGLLILQLSSVTKGVDG
mmetsp:Transcript_54373/g.119061  ORF Transcript_54373/g.119061 Transcript_54373/m.119061 type:complete len:204 (+) Transcript_54373:65-676(+)